MFTSSEAIVLQAIPFKYDSALVKLFTRQNGLASCWVNSLHGKSSPIKAVHIEPLTIANVILDRKKSQKLPVLKELQILIPVTSIKKSIEKSSIVIFISELLSKCFKEGDTALYPSEEQAAMFDFIKESILVLENSAAKSANFHLSFMIRLSEHLGIFPKGSFSPSTQFLSIEEGVYCSNPPHGKPFIEPPGSEWISKLSFLPITEFAGIEMPSSVRTRILHGLLEYFEIHAGTGPLKSHHIFSEIF